MQEIQFHMSQLKEAFWGDLKDFTWGPSPWKIKAFFRSSTEPIYVESGGEEFGQVQIRNQNMLRCSQLRREYTQVQIKIKPSQMEV